MEATSAWRSWTGRSWNINFGKTLAKYLIWLFVLRTVTAQSGTGQINVSIGKAYVLYLYRLGSSLPQGYCNMRTLNLELSKPG